MANKLTRLDVTAIEAAADKVFTLTGIDLDITQTENGEIIIRDLAIPGLGGLLFAASRALWKSSSVKPRQRGV